MAPPNVPLRVDFAGGWLDVPKFAIPGAPIVNCAISPLVSLSDWPYERNSGLGGSAAWSVLNGLDAVQTELAIAGWQDPAIITETGLCIWRSGPKPILQAKVNPDFLSGLMALYYTGRHHYTDIIVNNPRNYTLIVEAGITAARAAIARKADDIALAVNMSYFAQMAEGMAELPVADGCLARKYAGSGWGGYALFLFRSEASRNAFCQRQDTMRIEPFMRDYAA